ncbi:hypothetical protein [uncultured Sphingomonas sp.]|uniref:hypothetical protein n=1 Tax=uncultured Sphingomonas sp. TaxID=158754 RepID=UPI0025DE3992|nr:hypothetical protein [uncultured Sphingomonas sp.]
MSEGEDPQDRSLQALGLAITPGGLHSQDSVRKVGPDETVHLARRRRDRPKPSDKWLSGQAARANWIVATYCKGGVIQEFVADIVVPAEPARHGGQTVYVFPGLQDDGGTLILQPVLQWGAQGDPPGWRLCSWMVDRVAGTANRTASVPVAPGIRVQGRMRVIGRAGNRFTYECTFDGQPATRLQASLPGLNTAVAVLEAYGIKGAPDYPPEPAIRVDQVRLTPRSPAAWATQDIVTDVGQHAEIVSAAEPCVFALHCRP